MVSRTDPAYDPTVYPVEDDLGEHELQTYMRELLRPLLARLFAERGIVAHVGSDQFIYWVQYTPTRSVAPDIYVLPGVSQDIAIGAWKVWLEGGIVPSFALEFVSRDMRKDYLDGPRRYEDLGVDELVVFDPKPSRRRVAWQVFRRVDGRFELAERTNADRIRSEVLGCWLRRVGVGDATRVRIGLDPLGEELFPTIEEKLAVAEAELARLKHGQ
jgi:hypothetical protein